MFASADNGKAHYCLVGRYAHGHLTVIEASRIQRRHSTQISSRKHRHDEGAQELIEAGVDGSR